MEDANKKAVRSALHAIRAIYFDDSYSQDDKRASLRKIHDDVEKKIEAINADIGNDERADEKEG